MHFQILEKIYLDLVLFPPWRKSEIFCPNIIKKGKIVQSSSLIKLKIAREIQNNLSMRCLSLLFYNDIQE